MKHKLQVYNILQVNESQNNGKMREVLHKSLFEKYKYCFNNNLALLVDFYLVFLGLN